MSSPLPIRSAHEKFASYAYSFPMSSWYVIELKSPERLMGKLRNVDFYRKRNPDPNNIAQVIAANSLLHDIAQHGIFLGMDIKFPEVSFRTSDTEWASNVQRGMFNDAKVTSSRENFNALSIAFYETSHSISDSFFRPWVHLSGFSGSVSRALSDPNNYKTDISITLLTRAGAGKTPKIRKIYNFYDCFPFKIASENKSYKENGNPVGEARIVDFQYNYVEITADPDDDTTFVVSRDSAPEDAPGFPLDGDKPTKVSDNPTSGPLINPIPEDGQYPLSFRQRGNEDDRNLRERVLDRVNQVISDAVRGLF